MILILLDLSAMFFVHRFPSFFFPAYRSFSRQWISLLAALFSFTHMSVWDAGAAVLFLLFLYSVVQMIRKRQSFLNWLSCIVLIVSILVTEAIGGWLLNHYAPPLSEYLDLTVSEYSVEELYEAADYYLHKASAYSERIERDENSHAVRQDFNSLSDTAGASYRSLSDTWPVFSGSSRPVKKFTLIGEYLLYNGIIGMFMPITGEASVPANVPVIPLPFTMCHEAAHRLGIASEQEANFAAFLACISSEDERFLYSGYYSAFGYCLSSLYSVSPDKVKELREKYDAPAIMLVFLDRADTRAAYDRYDSPLQEVSDNINDTYLKTFSQESGIRSYGEVTDYLIAWYLSGRDPSE